MNCPECQETLQRSLDGVPTDGAPTAPDPLLERHLAECPTCRDRHRAARAMVEVLRTAPQPSLPNGWPARVVATALRDRQRRRLRVRRSLYGTAALAAAILIMLLFGYLTRPTPGEGKPQVGPQVRRDQPRKDPAPQPEADRDQARPEPRKKEDAPPSFAELSSKLADRTLDQAKLLWTAANPVEGVPMPMGELPGVPDLDPAAQPLRQARQEMSEGLEAVSRSARRAIDYFVRELPMPEPTRE
jgi:hypothetical protein